MLGDPIVLAMIAADTDARIDFLAGAQPAASFVAQELARGSLFTTAVTRFELLSGVQTARQDRLTRELLAAIPALSLDEGAAAGAAHVKRSLGLVELGPPGTA